MNGFWIGFYEICEWLLILAGIGLFAVIGYIVVTALSLKTVVMRDAKRLYQPPLNSVKALAAAGKGVVIQEQVRVKHIGGQFKIMAGDVKATATQIGGAAKTIHPSDLKGAATNAKDTLRFVTTLMSLFRATSKQTPAP